MKTKIINVSTIFKTVLFISVTLLIVGCASKANKQKNDVLAAKKATTEDITRPPEFVQSTTKSEDESKPGDTVSYDEWQKRRQDTTKKANPETESDGGLREIKEPEEPIKIP